MIEEILSLRFQCIPIKIFQFLSIFPEVKLSACYFLFFPYLGTICLTSLENIQVILLGVFVETCAAFWAAFNSLEQVLVHDYLSTGKAESNRENIHDGYQDYRGNHHDPHLGRHLH